jgi:hypothetical protein
MGSLHVGGVGARFISRCIRGQIIEVRCERRFSHLHLASVTVKKKRAIAS